jgi:uncharacterized lipoprotein YbaY
MLHILSTLTSDDIMPPIFRHSPLIFSMMKPVALIHILPALVIFLSSGCSLTSAIRGVDESELAGTASGLLQTPLPPEAKLHVLLRGKDPSSGEQRIIADQTIGINPESSSSPFSLKYETRAIREDHYYSLQACVTVNGKLLMVSHPDTSVLTHGAHDPAEINLKEYRAGEKTLEFTDWLARGETALQSGIQTNLSGICKHATTGYDNIFVAKASEILAPEWLSGPHHQVREQVSLRGPHYFFEVDSDYGTFSAQGKAMLRRLVREIQAIEQMRETKRTKAFAHAFSESALAPFGELKDVILHPLPRLEGIAKGFATIVESTAAAFTQGRSIYEDRYLESLVTVSKYKRQYSSQLDIDVYSSNPEVQKELDSIGWAAALGNWTPTAVLYPFTGPARITYSAFGWSETLNRMIIEEAPDALRARNNRLMTKMTIPNELRDAFLNHNFYSPRHQTFIVGALNIMDDTLDREKFIRQAVAAKSEIDAFTFQQLAELLAGFHTNRTPIARILVHAGIPIGYTRNKELVMILPADIVRWTPHADNIISSFGSEIPAEIPVDRKILWITGSATENLQHNMDRLGISLKVEAGDILKLKD